jgi:hypothetical protein
MDINSNPKEANTLEMNAEKHIGNLYYMRGGQRAI